MMSADDALTRRFVERAAAVHGVDPSAATGGAPSELVIDTAAAGCRAPVSGPTALPRGPNGPFASSAR
jgi:hypothetical protein